MLLPLPVRLMYVRDICIHQVYHLDGNIQQYADYQVLRAMHQHHL